MMGGAEPILAEGKELYDQGNYRVGMEILNKLVYAEPTNQPAKNLLADVFEQIGYQNWFNNRCLLEPIGNPPTEAEARHVLLNSGLPA
jgi:alkyl sulfatase BDS1-like metallo-beta-lactamase superfamily hydrolase